MTRNATLRPIVFGEVLFDVFPDGGKKLGGAPFNVAWHLQGFGLAPVMISRIGRDAHGEEILATMYEWGMDVQGIQIDEDTPSGEVQVKFSGGEPSYDILPQRAYDNLEWGTVRKVIDSTDGALLYHGSLIARGVQSASTLSKAIESVSYPVFMDVNLRPKCWTIESVTDLLATARWVKLNHEELEVLSQEQGDEAEQVASLKKRFNLHTVIVTRGSRGAVLYPDQGEALHQAPQPVTDIKDTVGAGDAFAAVMILSFLRGWDLRDGLSRAVEFAAQVCRVQGALVRDKSMFEEFRNKWEMQR